MVNLFIEQTPPALQGMREALDKNDLVSFRAQAHKMKPSLTFMGIASLKGTIDRLEDYSARQINTNLLPELLEEVESVCSRAMDELQHELKAIV
jgi:HPt (histidine-containing phosphotransfer) domain-containing protein